MLEEQSKEELQNLVEQQESKEDIAENNEEKVLGKEVRAVVSQVIQEFSGPLPPPNVLKQYDIICPGAAERILSMAERQSEHRQNIENKMIKSEARDSFLGVVFAFLLGMSCLVVAAIIVINVPESAGAIFGALLGATGIGSILAIFLRNTRASYNKNNEHD